MKISLFLFIIFLFVTCGVAIPQKSTPGTLPKAEGGIMDLSAYDFVKGDLIKLDGEWEFYWDRLLGPGDFRKTDARAARYGAVPLYWTEYRDAQLPARGGATYRLRIKTSGVREALSIQMPEIFTEFKLWINGRVMDAHGSFTGNAVRFLKPDLCTFLNDSGTIEIILQIRNYAHSNAGIGQSFLLGSPERVSRNRLSSLLLEMILISICIFASIYHIIMFAFRREERDILYFALFTLALALRTMMTGNTFVMQIFPDLPFEIGSRVATAVIPACVITFLMFTYHFFSEPEPRSVMRALLGLHLLYVLLVFVTPTFFYSTVFAYYLIVIIITGLYVWGIAIASMIRGNWYAVIFLIGFAFVFIGLLNDILHYRQIIYTGYYLSLWFSAFIIAHSLLLAIRFSNEHRAVKQMSKRLQLLDRLKDEFLANTSHEFRTPVNGIIGIGESLMDGAAGPLSPKVLKNLEVIVSSGKRLASLINDMLDYSKLKNNDIVIQNKPVDIKQLVSIVMNVIRATIPDKNVELQNMIPEDAPLVLGDENRLQQIMYNLIVNAFKFTHQGFVRVGARDRGYVLEINVEDTGIGIPEDRLADVFKSFEQVDGSIAREFGGTGLGLSITKNLVELHGGAISVASVVGIGSRFSFTLKKATAEEFLLPEGVGKPVERKAYGKMYEKQYKDDPVVDEKREGNATSRILLVDDEKINIQVLMNYLSARGYGYDFAFNGIEALDMIEKNDYDLVLLDIMMPRMSGFDVCKRLREKYSTFELPILVLTARNQPGDIVAAFNLGANDYIVKPFDKNELMARIDTHLSLKKAVRSAIENARLANTDSLTGMYNRRYFWNIGGLEYAGARQQGKNLSVMMLDIDNFKLINDTYGHENGNRVLRLLASIITNNIRGVDISGRYGGDEFIVILSDTDIAGARYVAEKIRKLTESERLKTESGIVTYTVSIGVVGMDNSVNTFDELAQKADVMMYRAKQNGKNRIEVPS